MAQAPARAMAKVEGDSDGTPRFRVADGAGPDPKSSCIAASAGAPHGNRDFRARRIGAVRGQRAACLSARLPIEDVRLADLSLARKPGDRIVAHAAAAVARLCRL